LKHANSPARRETACAGARRRRSSCQSSTLAHQSEQVFAAALIPIINPATLQTISTSGLCFALSRYSGCWIGFKRSARRSRVPSVYSDPSRVEIVLPTDFEMPRAD